MNLRSKILLATAIALTLTAASRADVTTEERIAITGAGMMKMINMHGTTITTISGQRARTASDLQFESGLMRTFAGGYGQTIEIVRLDEDKIYEINVKKKTYTETTFAERRAEMQKAMEQMQKSQGSQQETTTGIDESQCEWSDPKADVKRTGEKALVAGMQAERVSITATQSCKDKKTGEVCDFGLMLDQWLAPGFEATGETLDYQRAYAEKLGLTAASSRDFAERAQSLFGRYKGIFTEIAAKTRDLKGYPVKATFGLGVGGAQCKSTQEMQAQGGPAEPPSITGALGGALGGVFGGKKKPEPQAAAVPPPTMANGLIPLMTISNELVSVNRNGAAADTFEVPAGLKKVKK